MAIFQTHVLPKIDQAKEKASQVGSNLGESLSGNLGTIGVVAGSTAVLGTAGLLMAKAVTKKRKKSKAKSKKKKKSSKRKLKFGSPAYRKKYLGKRRCKHRRRGRKQRHPHTAGKRKDTSRRRIRFTCHNQPYVIGRNGKARFIKKSSVKRSRKLKGGRY